MRLWALNSFLPRRVTLSRKAKTSMFEDGWGIFGNNGCEELYAEPFYWVGYFSGGDREFSFPWNYGLAPRGLSLPVEWVKTSCGAHQCIFECTLCNERRPDNSLASREALSWFLQLMKRKLRDRIADPAGHTGVQTLVEIWSSGSSQLWIPIVPWADLSCSWELNCASVLKMW